MRARAGPSRQRGAISVMVAVLIATVAIGALVSIDVGFVFYTQRQLQKSVDLAALSGAQQLKRADDLPTTTANVLASVTAAASQNGYGQPVAANCADMAPGGADGMRACLGLWDPADPGNGDAVRHFSAGYNSAVVSPNAVRVQATRTVPLLFVLPGGQSRQLRAEAIAAGSPPVAAFAVGSGLLDLDRASGVLGLLLGNIVSLSVADWTGLASTTVTLDKLKLQLGAGTVQQLLDTQLSIQDFYALVLNAAGRQALLGAALGSPTTQLGLNGIGTRFTLGQMLDLGVLTPAASSAAEVGLNVASLLTTAAYVARGTDAVALNVPNLNLNTGLVNVSAVAALTVIEPPQVAVGPARQLADGRWRTTASTAQLGVRVAAQASVNLGLASAQVDLPVLLRAATARADLTGVQCAAARAQRRATLNVSSELVNACLSTDGRTCRGSGAPPFQIARVSGLGLGLASITAQPVTPARQRQSGTDVVLAPEGHARLSFTSTAVDQAISGLLNNLNPSLNVLGGDAKVDELLNLLAPPLSSLVGTLAGWLLTTLGINIANADVWLNGIDCNNAELVY
ncbi:TadG family pilus assembly protein [Cupriavidus pauculus]|nr:TadG family pilus assembly protein [Cupriavidus pauculus]